MPPARIWCLSMHARYQCRDSGACCSSGWPIPVEIPLYEHMTAAIEDGSLNLVDVKAPFAFGDALPEGAAALLAQTCDGICAFYESDARQCRLHRVKGHDWLPIACQQFPRMCLMDARGMRVTFSHYCPTAAALLFEDDQLPLALVENPPSVRPDVAYEGLDAREALPPLLRPGVLMDWETVDAFEAHALARLDAETASVDAAVAHIASVAEGLRAWRAADGPLIAAFARAINAASAVAREAQAINLPIALRLDADARAAVPAGVPCDAAPADASNIMEAHERWIAPAWPALTRPLCRYVAAKLFANWCWYQGQGLRTLMRALHAALAVLRVEAARQTLAHGRMLDRDLLRAAVRRTDLLLLHLCSQEALARRWSDAETHEAL